MVYMPARVINNKLTKGRKEVEKDITFIVESKAMPSTCTHTSTRITYHAWRYEDSVARVPTKRRDGSGTDSGDRNTSRSTNDDG